MILSYTDRMDPMQTLTEIRALVVKMKDAYYVADPQDGLDLANKINDLDEWLTQGGFVPGQWMRSFATMQELQRREAEEAAGIAEEERRVEEYEQRPGTLDAGYPWTVEG